MPELLEVYEPHGAFARIEGWLTDRGFFGPESDGLVAELYLGYGLSEAIRRGTMPPPPEPCRPLPLAACRRGGRRRERVARFLRDRTLGADVDGGRVRRGRRGGAYRDRPGRRLPGKPRAASPGAVLRRSARAGQAPPGAPAAAAETFRHRHLECDLRVPRALPLAAGRPPQHQADQGNAAARCGRRAPRLGEGRGRARHDRRSRTQRSLACVRGRFHPLARADGDAGASGRRAHGLDGRGDAPARRRAGERFSRRPSPEARLRALRRSRRSI